MDAYTLKTEALCWLRFGKKLPYVATEAGRWNADAVGLNEKFSVEVEVKTSLADLKREFVSKKSKHYLYSRASEVPAREVPNYFYFYVPSDMEQAALEVVARDAPKAGLAVYDESGTMDGKRTRVVKRPSKLHERAPAASFVATVLNRMGSELCGRYVTARDFQKEVRETMVRVDEKLVDLVRRSWDTPDPEEEAPGGDPKAG